jgi:EF hand
MKGYKMKTTIKSTLALLALGVSAFALHAQDNGGPPQGGPGGHHHPPPLPIMQALDTNHDGIIDSNEIANASAELLTLDKNGDGQLTKDEYLPPRPPNADSMGQGFHPPKSPLVTALDVNNDGIIDSNEIANAPAELKTLDKNGDGQLTRDEIRPPRPHDMDGPPPDAGGSGDDGPPGPPPNQ